MPGRQVRGPSARERALRPVLRRQSRELVVPVPDRDAALRRLQPYETRFPRPHVLGVRTRGDRVVARLGTTTGQSAMPSVVLTGRLEAQALRGTVREPLSVVVLPALFLVPALFLAVLFVLVGVGERDVAGLLVCGLGAVALLAVAVGLRLLRPTTFDLEVDELEHALRRALRLPPS